MPHTRSPASVHSVLLHRMPPLDSLLLLSPTHSLTRARTHTHTHTHSHSHSRHSRSPQDDGRGVGEPLNETGLAVDNNGIGAIIRGVHRLSIDTAATAGVNRRNNVAQLLYRPVVRSSPLGAGVSPSQWVAGHKASFSGVAAALPANVHLLTVHAWNPTTILLRLSHSYEVGEDAALSKPVSVDLGSIFSNIMLTTCTERTISGNQNLADVPQITYSVTNGPKLVLPIVNPAPSGPKMTVTIGVFEIRTWLCTVMPMKDSITLDGPATVVAASSF